MLSFFASRRYVGSGAFSTDGPVQCRVHVCFATGSGPERATSPSTANKSTGTLTRLVQFVGLPLDNKVRANQVPRSVSRAEPVRCLVVTVNMPSRARSAVVIPDIGLPPNAPCQAPFFLLSPPALKQATNAFFLLGDSSSIGACRSPGARNDAEEEQIVSFREAGSSGLLLRLVMSAPLDMTKLLRRLPRRQ